MTFRDLLLQLDMQSNCTVSMHNTHYIGMRA